MRIDKIEFKKDLLASDELRIENIKIITENLKTLSPFDEMREDEFPDNIWWRKLLFINAEYCDPKSSGDIADYEMEEFALDVISGMIKIHSMMFINPYENLTDFNAFNMRIERHHFSELSGEERIISYPKEKGRSWNPYEFKKTSILVDEHLGGISRTFHLLDDGNFMIMSKLTKRMDGCIKLYREEWEDEN